MNNSLINKCINKSNTSHRSYKQFTMDLDVLLISNPPFPSLSVLQSYLWTKKNPKNEVSLFLNKLLTDVQSFRFCWSYNVYICERFNKIR